MSDRACWRMLGADRIRSRSIRPVLPEGVTIMVSRRSLLSSAAFSAATLAAGLSLTALPALANNGPGGNQGNNNNGDGDGSSS